jgi:hypothetical protein
MKNIIQSKYHDEVVRPKLKHQPWLDILHKFLDPNKKGFTVAKEHRLEFFNVKVIQISWSREIGQPIKCINPTEFEEAIRGDKERGSTLVIAQDLSQLVINTLGMQYKLKPEFFASHIQGTQCFQIGNWKSLDVQTPDILPDYLWRAPFYTIEFRRLYHINKGLPCIVKLRSSNTCTPRGAQILREDLPNAFIFEKILVYHRKRSSTGKLDCRIITNYIMNATKLIFYTFLRIILTNQLICNKPHALYIPYAVTFLDNNLATLPPKGQRYQVLSRKEIIR